MSDKNSARQKTSSLFVPPGHFYSPIVDVEELRPRFSIEPAPGQLPGIAIDDRAHMRLWEEFLPYLQQIPFPERATAPFRYYFENPAFSYADASILYAMLCRFRPRRLTEVGCGFSSVCALDTIDRYLQGNVDVTFIEPHPELLLNLAGDHSERRFEVHAQGVQNADASVFSRLEDGDFLLIDSTHVMKTGSDVCHELFTLLPSLKPGVFVHFHDIFWPFEYGPTWVLDENRSWNEVYGLRAFLMYNDTFEITFFNDYFSKKFRGVVQGGHPIMLRNTGGSLWLRKVR